MVGSAQTINLPAPLVNIESITAVSGTEGLSAEPAAGQLELAAAASTLTIAGTLQVEGSGCTTIECGRRFILTIPTTVVPLYTPSGPLEELTEPSPDRAVASTEAHLTDELLIVLGTPGAPGSQDEAKADAQAVGGTVTGGLAGTGIYEIRWPSTQDLEARTNELRLRPSVTAVSPVSLTPIEATGSFPEVDSVFDTPEWTWPYAQTDAAGAWSISTGTSVRVGIIDEGNVYTQHEDLSSVETMNRGKWVYQPQAHATHVAGLACAEAYNAGMVGMAWGCPIVSARAGHGSDYAIYVLQSMYAMARRGDVRVVNISLGTNVANKNGDDCATASEVRQLEAQDAAEAPLFRQVLAGIGASIVWTFSAGNDCAPTVASPWAENASLSNVLTAAATNSDGSLANFSDYGDAVKLAAPGGVAVAPLPAETGLMSTWVTSCTADHVCPCTESLGSTGYCGDYEADFGTSMAAPLVAGAAADVWAADSNINAAEVGQCITTTAGTAGWATSQSESPIDAPYTPTIPFTGQATPILDVQAAVECAARKAREDGEREARERREREEVERAREQREREERELNEGGANRVTDVSLGSGASCDVLISGHVECWGTNAFGQLATGSTEGPEECPNYGSCSARPRLVAGIEHAEEVRVASAYTQGFGDYSGNYVCARETTGAVLCWGEDSLGEAGGPSHANVVARPTRVEGITHAVALSVGYWYSCALESTGAVSCWGNNYYGELGVPAGTELEPCGEAHCSAKAVAADGVQGAIQISVGPFGACAVLKNGKLMCWGARRGVEEPEFNELRTEPVEVSGITQATSVSVSPEFTCAVDNGHVKCWGADLDGQLGNGERTYSIPTPVEVHGISTATSVYTSYGWNSGRHGDACAILASGNVDCWGYNGQGELGDGTTTTSAVPVQAKGIEYAETLVMGTGYNFGEEFICAVEHGGAAYCWGETYYLNKEPILEATNALGVAIGYDRFWGDRYDCILLRTGVLACDGINDYGQLGTGQDAANSLLLRRRAPTERPRPGRSAPVEPESTRRLEARSADGAFPSGWSAHNR